MITTTAPELNINVAHFPYELVKRWFISYWMFWPVCLIVITAMVWVVEFGLVTLYPPHPANPGDPVDQAYRAQNDARLVADESL